MALLKLMCQVQDQLVFIVNFMFILLVVVEFIDFIRIARFILAVIVIIINLQVIILKVNL